MVSNKKPRKGGGGQGKEEIPNIGSRTWKPEPKPKPQPKTKEREKEREKEAKKRKTRTWSLVRNPQFKAGLITRETHVAHEIHAPRTHGFERVNAIDPAHRLDHPETPPGAFPFDAVCAIGARGTVCARDVEFVF